MNLPDHLENRRVVFEVYCFLKSMKYGVLEHANGGFCSIQVVTALTGKKCAALREWALGQVSWEGDRV